MQLFSLSGKTIVITGGGSGIGRSIAELFARQGAIIFIIELNSAGAEDTVRAIEEANGKAHAIACNVSNQKEVNDTFLAIQKEAVKIDVLVNCAGIAHIGNLENTTEADFNKVFNVNVKGAYNCMKATIENMKEHGGFIRLNN